MQKINPEKFYTSKDIVEMNILTASNSNTKRQMLLRFIREGRITAINLGGDNKPRYIVQGKHLIEYMNSQLKPKQYIKK